MITWKEKNVTFIISTTIADFKLAFNIINV